MRYSLHLFLIFADEKFAPGGASWHHREKEDKMRCRIAASKRNEMRPRRVLCKRQIMFMCMLYRSLSLFPALSCLSYLKIAFGQIKRYVEGKKNKAA